MKRYYYRCSDCCSTMVLEERLPGVECACGGELILLGPVTDTGHWRRVEERPACDGRCTGAHGPRCDCQCRGENHGTGLVVRVYRDGGVAKVNPPDEAAIRRAAEYRQARERVYATLAERFGENYERFLAGRWVSQRSAWETMYLAHKALKAIGKLATHAARMRKLAALEESIRKG